jgi:hypothetical protein
MVQRRHFIVLAEAIYSLKELRVSEAERFELARAVADVFQALRKRHDMRNEWIFDRGRFLRWAVNGIRN